jgi:hypothetical protein
MYRPRSGFGATVQDLAGGITRFEGACSSPGVCRNNNPGNLRAGPGSTGVDARGIAIFPDFETGEAALERQIGLNIDRGLTLDEFFGGKQGVYAGYAPAADQNNPGQYSSTVASWIGIDPSIPLSSALSGEGTPILDSGDGSGGPFDFATDQSPGLSSGAIAALGIAAVALLLVGTTS